MLLFLTKTNDDFYCCAQCNEWMIHFTYNILENKTDTLLQGSITKWFYIKCRRKCLQTNQKLDKLFRQNTGKYGPEITPYLDTFHAVYMVENIPYPIKLLKLKALRKV